VYQADVAGKGSIAPFFYINPHLPDKQGIIPDK